MPMFPMRIRHEDGREEILAKKSQLPVGVTFTIVATDVYDHQGVTLAYYRKRTRIYANGAFVFESDYNEHGSTVETVVEHVANALGVPVTKESPPEFEEADDD